MKPLLILFTFFLASPVFAQYDFRTIPRNTNEEFFFFANRALDDGSFAAIGIVENDSMNTSQAILVKWNCLGQVEWARYIGGSIKVNNTRGGIVQAENGDLVVAYNLALSWTTSSMLVGRFTMEGEPVWTKRIGLSKEYARDIIATPDGGFIVAGSTGSFGVDLQRADIYLIKLDGDGNIEWNKTYGNVDAYDDAYNISLSSDNHLLLTGRYIVGGTFYCFFMKADLNGNPVIFKGFGQPNHRTYAFDVQETPDGDYLISGYTTIAKVDFMSNGDAFLLKLAPDGELLWANIFEPTEEDRNDFGFSIVFEDDGDYGLALESSSFQAIGGPQAPNKNVVFSLTDDGYIKDVILFNPKGSQYTTMTKASDGGYFLTGFSTYYENNVTFEGFAFKTDANYQSGGNCEYYYRSDKVSTLQLDWDVQDLTYTSREGQRIVDYDAFNSFKFDEDHFLCFTYPDFASEIVLDDTTYCQGESISLSTSNEGNINDWTWHTNGDTTKGENTSIAIDSVGQFFIYMTATDGCQTTKDSVLVVISQGEVIEVQRQLCPGDSLMFRDSVIYEPGQYRFSNENVACDTVYLLEVSHLIVDTNEVVVGLCEGKALNINGQTIDSLGFHVVSFSTSSARDSIVRYEVIREVPDTLHREVETCPGQEVVLFGQSFDQVDTVYNVIKQGEYCDTIVYLTIVSIENGCPCKGEFPNAFTPNGDGVNDEFGMFEVENGCSPLEVQNFEMRIFNRWGQLVFESNNVEERWDGTFKGEDALSEVYIMSCTYQFAGKLEQETRDVTLVR